MTPRSVYLIPIFLKVLFCGAQEKLGIANSNYHPVSSIHLNPSTSSDSRAYLQFNLLGLNAFLKTNMGYLKDFSLFSAYSSGNIVPEPDKRKTRKFLYANLVADGPTFIISKRNYGAGVFVRARSVVDMRRIPYELTEMFLGLRDVSDFSQGRYSVKNAKMSNMTWVEYGLNLAAMVKKKNKTLITAGVNLKYLTGINILHANLRTLEAEYSSTSLSVDTMYAIVKYNQPAFRSGRGYGLDIGFTYKRMLEQVDYYYANSKRSACNYKDYKYKFGISLRDAGYIKYRGGTTINELSGGGRFSTEVQDSSLESVINLRFRTSTVQGKPITAFTPASLSGQLDYNFETNVFLNITLIKNLIPTRATGVQSPDLLCISPRFETKNFEAALPLTFQKFRYPHLGFAFRFRTFVLGFDNVFPLLIKRDTYGMGIYFNLGLSLFRNQACNGKIRRVDDCAPKSKSKKKKGQKREYNMNRMKRKR